MFATGSRGYVRLTFKRFQSSGAKLTFSNKYNFNINPPPVHEYWNARNNIILLAFVPVFLGVGYVAKYVGGNVYGDSVLEAVEGEDAFINGNKIFESQLSSK
ncbi:uncharacterized protein PRCAT00001641001 [Priceomyces carsonii]|uniref:uncharacterized protein n=1 Tax=Priceomyces carsonii TaxID=28549 RepID=UPI002EDA65B4|nr:unnamed protein product [Priceomyces carsonii]